MHRKVQAQVILLPKIRIYFAEFPNESSPNTPKLIQLATLVLVLGTIITDRIEQLFTDPRSQQNPQTRAAHALYCFSS